MNRFPEDLELIGAAFADYSLRPAAQSRKALKRAAKIQRSKRGSANLIVDLANTADYRASVMIGSGSNLIVGQIIDLLGANTYCNVFVAGGVGGGSGAIEVRIQTADDTASGSFTDPTSGLLSTNLPVNVVSGGIIFANSGLWSSGYASVTSPVDSAPLFCSGGVFFGAFQRPQRYARLINNSGPYPGAITAGFVSQKKTTGSGGGFSYSPTSGSVSV